MKSYDFSENGAQETRHPPLVSIGMPVYNGEAFIREALDSLMAQTFADFELIISDNASTDKTANICREYAKYDKRIRFFRHLKNKGAFSNFKFVLNKSIGTYFMWAASDDLFSKDWIAELLPIVKQHKCLAFGRISQIDEDRNNIHHPANGKKLCFDGPKLFRRIKYLWFMGVMGKANPIYGLAHTELFRQLDLSILKKINNGSDQLFLFTLLKNFQIKTSKQKVFLLKRIKKRSSENRIKAVFDIWAFLKIKVSSLINIYNSSIQDWNNYRKYCDIFETLIYSLIFPVILLRNLILIPLFFSEKKLQAFCRTLVTTNLCTKK